ncbi:S8 family peptidase [Actinokineospora sp. HUAS TT18]|uniref:S8 family peptidase n=1 Tax=Actinokineospora sp. HUAS TT18 TaxID=3447451 RepID=UPI003F5239AA
MTDQIDAPWPLDRIDQRNQPLNNKYTYDEPAGNVRVYVIDTGIRTTHSAFQGRAHHGRDTVDEDNDASDCDGHGTNVAGVVGGAKHGVAKSVKLIAVRVLDCNRGGSMTNVIQGIDWVTSNHIKPAVINISLGGKVSSVMDDAVRRAINAGITVVVGAANDNKDACGYSPARVSEALTVGASTKSDERASFSNFGSCLDLFAPGKDIFTTSHLGDDRFVLTSGTSIAAPHVAGAAALYLAKNPAASPARVSEAIKADATTGKIMNPGSGSPNRLLFRVHGPVVTELVCETGSQNYVCSADANSGASPLRTQWKRNGVHIPSWDGRFAVNTQCATGENIAITFTVSDANGVSDSYSRSFTCSALPMP